MSSSHHVIHLVTIMVHPIHLPCHPFTISVITMSSRPHPLSPPGDETRGAQPEGVPHPAEDHRGEGCQHPGADPAELPQPPARPPGQEGGPGARQCAEEDYAGQAGQGRRLQGHRCLRVWRAGGDTRANFVVPWIKFGNTLGNIYVSKIASCRVQVIFKTRLCRPCWWQTLHKLAQQWCFN